jgi:hypothetical protein
LRKYELPMWTHEMPSESLVRQNRERLYAEWPQKDRDRLRKIAAGFHDTPERYVEPSVQMMRNMFLHLLADYDLWVADQKAKEAA